MNETSKVRSEAVFVVSYIESKSMNLYSMDLYLLTNVSMIDYTNMNPRWIDVLSNNWPDPVELTVECIGTSNQDLIKVITSSYRSG